MTNTNDVNGVPEIEAEKCVKSMCSGHPSDRSAMTVGASTITSVVQKLREAGISYGNILALWNRIWTFIREHGDDVEKIVDSVKDLISKF